MKGKHAQKKFGAVRTMAPTKLSFKTRGGGLGGVAYKDRAQPPPPVVSPNEFSHGHGERNQALDSEVSHHPVIQRRGGGGGVGLGWVGSRPRLVAYPRSAPPSLRDPTGRPYPGVRSQGLPDC